jgi:hypothetical protein
MYMQLQNESVAGKERLASLYEEKCRLEDQMTSAAVGAADGAEPGAATAGGSRPAERQQVGVVVTTQCSCRRKTGML